MAKIFKYKLEKIKQDLELPAGSKILSLQTQSDIPCLWILVDPEKDKVKRTFETFATGEEIPPAPREYIGTFQLLRGGLVFHVFELKHHYPE